MIHATRYYESAAQMMDVTKDGFSLINAMNSLRWINKTHILNNLRVQENTNQTHHHNHFFNQIKIFVDFESLLLQWVLRRNKLNQYKFFYRRKHKSSFFVRAIYKCCHEVFFLVAHDIELLGILPQELFHVSDLKNDLFLDGILEKCAFICVQTYYLQMGNLTSISDAVSNEHDNIS